MATYPSININTILSDSNNTESENFPKIFISGFSFRGVSYTITEIHSIAQFESIFGKPTTDIEYASYNAVINALNGGVVVDFFRIPYTIQKNIKIDNTISYFCDMSNLNNAENIIKTFDTNENYIKKSLEFHFNTELSKLDIFNWKNNKEESDTHELKISLKNDSRTIFKLHELNSEFKSFKGEGKSLGIAPIFIGSLNEVLLKTQFAGIFNVLQNYFKNNPIKYNSSVLELTQSANIFESDLFFNFKKIENLYLDLLSNLELNNIDKRNKQSALIIVEFLLNDDFEIYFEVVEIFTGIINSELTIFENNLIEEINKKSNFIKIELIDLKTNNKINYIEFNEKDKWTFVNFSDFKIFGLNSNIYDLPLEDEFAYLFNKEEAFSEIDKYITSLSFKNFFLDRVYDYVLTPGLTDCFNKLTGKDSFESEIETSYKFFIIDGKPVVEYDITDKTTGVIIFSNKISQLEEDDPIGMYASIKNNDLLLESSIIDEIFDLIKNDEIYLLHFDNKGNELNEIYKVFAENGGIHIESVCKLTIQSYEEYKPLPFKSFSRINQDKIYIKDGELNLDLDDNSEKYAFIIFKDLIDGKLYHLIKNENDKIGLKEIENTQLTIFNSIILKEEEQLYNIFVENGILITKLIEISDNDLLIYNKINAENVLKSFHSEYCIELILLLNKFAKLDKDCTIFYDIPLKINFALKEISEKYNKRYKSDDLYIMEILEEIKSLNIINKTGRKYVDKLYQNFFFLFNHQYIDRFDNILNDYVIVPPSSEVIYSYSAADLLKVAIPLAYNNSVMFYDNCHKSIIPTNKNTNKIFETLLSHYYINSLNNDINNNTFINQQMFCREASASIFAQHHAFRVVKYLKMHIKLLSLFIKYEPNNEILRHKFSDSIKDVLQKYQQVGVLGSYQVICDNSNNTSQTIDNYELWCDIKFYLFGAIVKINLHIFENGVSLNIL